MNNTLQENTSVHTFEILKVELARRIVCEMFENSVICRSLLSGAVQGSG